MSDLAERLSRVERDRTHPNQRPRDAATLLVIDGTGETARLLMGRRHQRHVFMPGMFVFPGGRVDPADSRVPVASDYDPATAQKLMAAMRAPKGAARARAFGVAAVREAYEEAGLFVGSPDRRRLGGAGWEAFAERGLLPHLAPMRFVARAITPPRRPRRFDTRFLAVPADAVADRLPGGTGPSDELEEIAWVSIRDARAMPLPAITLTVLDELVARMADDPGLSPGLPVPFYRWQGNRFVRELI